MFSLLSILLHVINSIFSGIYTSQFLKARCNKKITIILWAVVYFLVQVVIFDIIHRQYSFNNMTGAMINVFIGLASLGVTGYGIWKNHNFTQEAAEAQKYLNELNSLSASRKT